MMVEHSERTAAMSKTFLPYDPEQQLLLPVALQEWLPQDHLAYFISDVVDQLDLSAITGLYEEQRGVKALLTAVRFRHGITPMWQHLQRTLD